jgi:hypothetical protein
MNSLSDHCLNGLRSDSEPPRFVQIVFNGRIHLTGGLTFLWHVGRKSVYTDALPELCNTLLNIRGRPA